MQACPGEFVTFTTYEFSKNQFDQDGALKRGLEIIFEGGQQRHLQRQHRWETRTKQHHQYNKQYPLHTFQL